MKPNKENLRDWGQHLEDAHGGEPTLDLANELRQRRPVPVRPSSAFVEELRQDLLASAAPKTPFHSWLAPAALVAAVAVMVGAVFLLARPVSTAQVFEGANQRYAGLANEAGVLHTGFTLSYTELDIFDQSVISEHEWNGELWQDLSGPDFRHQLTDPAGMIQYFAQRRGDRFWRSAYPVLAEPGDLIYVMNEEQFYAPGRSMLLGMAPIMGNLIDWLSLESWWLAVASECANPFCAIGLEASAAWTCDNDQCAFPQLSAGDGAPGAGYRVNLIGQEQLSDNRTVHVMQMRVGPQDHLVREMRFDADTYALVELVAYQFEMEMARMTFSDREILDQGAQAILGVLPDQLREVVWDFEDPPPAPRIAPVDLRGAPTGLPRQVWFRPVFALPKAGSTLSGESELVVFLELNGAPQEQDVELTAELCSARPPESAGQFDPSASCGGLAVARVTVPKQSGTVRVAIPIDPDQSWPVTVWIYFRWQDPDGNQQGLLNPDYFWHIEP